MFESGSCHYDFTVRLSFLPFLNPPPPLQFFLFLFFIFLLLKMNILTLVVMDINLPAGIG